MCKRSAVLSKLVSSLESNLITLRIRPEYDDLLFIACRLSDKINKHKFYISNRRLLLVIAVELRHFGFEIIRMAKL